MSKLMVGVSGVRGIFGKTLDPITITKFAAHFGILCQRGTIIVGRDSRTTGQAVLNSVKSALMSVGCDVIDIGIVSTPTVLLSVKELSASGGISITASHNPPEWNAMKFVDSDGMFLSPQKAELFLSQVDSYIEWADWTNIGKQFEDFNAIERHIDKVLSIPYLNVPLIQKKQIKVVIDSVNGAGGLCSPLLLKKLGCEVIEINSDPTGIFAHPAEPLNHNLYQLEQAVVLSKADIGFATDPDVDRLSIVSNKGLCIGEELSVALAEMYVLDKTPSDIVVNLSSSMISNHIAKLFNVNVHRTKVGEINVGKKMQELRCSIGGEGNGGIICSAVNYTRDALAGMALILGLIAERNQSISEIVSTLPAYYFAKGKIELPHEVLDSIMSKTQNILKGYSFDLQDGIKAIKEDHWIHIRKSGTEPIIRVYVESDSIEKSNCICEDLIHNLTS